MGGGAGMGYAREHMHRLPLTLEMSASNLGVYNTMEKAAQSCNQTTPFHRCQLFIRNTNHTVTKSDRNTTRLTWVSTLTHSAWWWHSGAVVVEMAPGPAGTLLPAAVAPPPPPPPAAPAVGGSSAPPDSKQTSDKFAEAAPPKTTARTSCNFVLGTDASAGAPVWGLLLRAWSFAYSVFWLQSHLLMCGKLALEVNFSSTLFSSVRRA